eukprot:XP_001696887.1 predicted protein [Chlamydomonas reinhardtii]
MLPARRPVSSCSTLGQDVVSGGLEGSQGVGLGGGSHWRKASPFGADGAGNVRVSTANLRLPPAAERAARCAHDWVICCFGEEVRYNIQLYFVDNMAGTLQAFAIGARPAMDSVEAALDRVKMNIYLPQAGGSPSAAIPRAATAACQQFAAGTSSVLQPPELNVGPLGVQARSHDVHMAEAVQALHPALVDRAAAAAGAEPPSSCPVNPKYKNPAVYNVYGQRINDPNSQAKPSPLASITGADVLDPKNNMPLEPNQLPCPGQRKPLSTERVASNIPKGGTESTWLFPSPQMVFNALKRKGKGDDVTEDDMDGFIAAHNSVCA